VRCGQHCRRARRNAYREPPWAGKAPALARLHQLDREHGGYRASRLPQREPMAKCGKWHCAGPLPACWRRRKVRSIKGLQAPAGSQSCAAAHQSKYLPNQLKTTLTPHRIFHGDACFAYFNKIWASPASGSSSEHHRQILTARFTELLGIRTRRQHDSSRRPVRRRAFLFCFLTSDSRLRKLRNATARN